MKNRIVKGILPMALAALMFACNPKKEETAAIDKEQIKQEIQAKEDEFAALYNSGELKDIGYYADDAKSFFQNRPALVGKQAIVEFLKSDLSSKFSQIEFITNEVFVSNDGNMVVEFGSFKVSESTEILNSGNYMSLFEKRDGKYVCVRDMSASELPL